MTEPNDSEILVCFSCAGLNRADAHFCQHCQVPLSTHATTDPILSIRSRGYALSKGSSKQQKPIVLIGMLLWVGPVFLGSFLLLCEMIIPHSIRHPPDRIENLLLIVFVAFITWITGAILYKTLTNYRWGSSTQNATPTAIAEAPVIGQQAVSAEKCLACGQSLSSTETECAACGWSFDSTGN